MVSQELLEKFKMIYKEEFNIELTDEEATKMATDLLNVMRVITQPVPKSELEETYQDQPKVEGELYEAG